MYAHIQINTYIVNIFIYICTHIGRVPHRESWCAELEGSHRVLRHDIHNVYVYIQICMYTFMLIRINMYLYI